MRNLIVAIGKNNLIGKDNDLPWNYKEDLQYFKQTTLNKTVVMGENTFYSIFSRTNKLLPNRKMVVATFNKDFKHEGVEVIYDLEKYLKETTEDVFVIGGCQIYKASLDLVAKGHKCDDPFLKESGKSGNAQLEYAEKLKIRISEALADVKYDEAKFLNEVALLAPTGRAAKKMSDFLYIFYIFIVLQVQPKASRLVL